MRETDTGRTEYDNDDLRQRLTHSYSLLQYIVENDLSAVAVLNRDMKYVYVSRRFLKDYDVKENDILGKSHYEIFPDLPDAWKEAHRRALNGEVLRSEEDSFTGKNGTIEWVRWECRPWYESDGSTGGIVLYTEVITRKKETELELLKAKEKAEESDRLKTAFLQNISHEVRTPLNSIVGFAELLSEPGLPISKMSSFSRIISANSNKLIGIISDVIEISEIHSGQVKVLNSKFDIISIFSRISDSFREITLLKELEYKVIQLIPEEKSSIFSDRVKLEKIYYHLIDNAVKFTHKGSIKVISALEGDTLMIEVSDTGIGIAEDKQKIIFEPFRQVETGLNRSHGGTGLGLTIVKAFTESLGGNISLASELKNGTTVKVTIPVSFDIGDRHVQKMHENEGINTILIAEDEYSNFKYLYEVLHSDKTRIIHARNGKEALEICKSGSDIQMILMDLKMPIMDGTSAARQIKEFCPSIPIIAQTAYIPEDEKLNSVFDDQIAKPISRADLTRKVSKYINV